MQYACFDEDIKSMDINRIKYLGGGTSFINAFDLVIKTIGNTKPQGFASDRLGHRNYIIIFMSDRQSGFSHSQMEKLSTMNYLIDQFWTIALGNTSMNVFEQINEKMGGTFKELKDSVDFVCCYAEIAPKSHIFSYVVLRTSSLALITFWLDGMNFAVTI